MNTVCNPTGLLASRFESSHHSVSNHPTLPPETRIDFLLRDLPSRKLSGLPHPLGRVPLDVIWASPLASRLAATHGRIEFVCILRTDGSPPVAPHPALRRRSNIRIQAPIQSLTRTSTSLIQNPCKRTGTNALVRESLASIIVK